jgi:hypothetical protein
MEAVCSSEMSPAIHCSKQHYNPVTIHTFTTIKMLNVNSFHCYVAWQHIWAVMIMANTVPLTYHTIVCGLSSDAYSPWRQWCNPRKVHIGFILYKVKFEHFLLWAPQFSHWNHSTDTPHSLSLTYQQHYNLHANSIPNTSLNTSLKTISFLQAITTRS